MIVEDSTLVRERLRELLLEIPQLELVGEYDNSAAAITALRQRAVDILLLDIKLRGSDGLDVLRNAKATLSNTTVVVFTNYAEAPYRDLFTQLGADYFFNKTYETEQLRDTLIRLANANN